VREFVELMAAKNAPIPSEPHPSPAHAIDWDAVEASVANIGTLEAAIGRAIVLADQMSRGSFPADLATSVLPPLGAEDPFFAFSMADVVPDFGDESRYRNRVVRRVARIFGPASQ
jgi:hypothetical protein